MTEDSYFRPLVVSGSPGSGKSSVCRFLATRDIKGVHLSTDYFFDFLPNVIDPSLPSARNQNKAVVKAYSLAATAYVEHGYHVLVDGVIGPWWFSEIHSVIGDFDYVLLSVSRETALQRVKERTGQTTARPSVLERMFPQFQRLEEEFAAHLIDSENHTLTEVADLISERIAAGQCVIRG